MSTLHLGAPEGGYAPTVLMPGDPLRAKYIAEQFLDDVEQVNSIRNMLGFTGTHNGNPVSVQGSGMGVPSIQLYATELYKDYGVERIIRVGSCGALQDHINLGDIVVGLAAGTDSGVNRRRFEGRDFPAVGSWELIQAVVDYSKGQSFATHVGSIFTSDFFYEPEGSDTFGLLERYGFLAVEMEAAGLYGTAAEYGAQALTVATVSDQIKRHESMSPEDRQTTFDDMVTLVLGALFS